MIAFEVGGVILEAHNKETRQIMHARAEDVRSLGLMFVQCSNIKSRSLYLT